MDGPGPGAYNVSGDAGKAGGPSYSMRARTDPADKASSQPGPGAYDLGTTVGKAPSKTMSPRYKETFSDNSPGPGAYNPAKDIGADSPRYSMTSRHAPNDLAAETPGPVSPWHVCSCPLALAIGFLAHSCAFVLVWHRVPTTCQARLACRHR